MAPKAKTPKAAKGKNNADYGFSLCNAIKDDRTPRTKTKLRDFKDFENDQIETIKDAFEIIVQKICKRPIAATDKEPAAPVKLLTYELGSSASAFSGLKLSITYLVCT
jgi:hypothetical protein